MLRIFFDINIVVTALLQRIKLDDQWHLPDVNTIWQANEEGKIEGYLASFSLPMIFGHCESDYYSKSSQANRHIARQQSRTQAYNDVRKCIDSLITHDFMRIYLLEADRLIDENASCNDFEDNLQLICAYHAGADIILTDNVRDFNCAKSYDIEVLTPTQLLKRI